MGIQMSYSGFVPYILKILLNKPSQKFETLRLAKIFECKT